MTMRFMSKRQILSVLGSLLRAGSVAVACLALVFVALFVVPLIISAQVVPSPRSPSQIDEDEILRIDTDLVPIDVTVTDASGRLVRNLRPEDFRLYENGVERPVAFFGIEQRNGDSRPVAAVFALDMSGSMRAEEIERMRTAINAFAEHLARTSSVFAVTSFGMEVRVLQNFTNDLGRLDRVFNRLAREPNGLSTHTYDAVDDAIRLLVRRAPRTRERRLLKRVVIVITDGFPVGDRVAPGTVIERANAAEVSVYTVTLPSFSRLSSLGLSAASTPLRPLPTPLDVSGLAERTGGTNSYATERDFDSMFRALAEEVTSTYVLAFYPAEQTRGDGQFHSIRVEAPAGLFVRQNRSGYTSETRRRAARREP